MTALGSHNPRTDTLKRAGTHKQPPRNRARRESLHIADTSLWPDLASATSSKDEERQRERAARREAAQHRQREADEAAQKAKREADEAAEKERVAAETARQEAARKEAAEAAAREAEEAAREAEEAAREAKAQQVLAALAAADEASEREEAAALARQAAKKKAKEEALERKARRLSAAEWAEPSPALAVWPCESTAAGSVPLKTLPEEDDEQKQQRYESRLARARSTNSARWNGTASPAQRLAVWPCESTAVEALPLKLPEEDDEQKKQRYQSRLARARSTNSARSRPAASPTQQHS